MSNKPTDFTVCVTHHKVTESEVISDVTAFIQAMQEYYALLGRGVLRLQSRKREAKKTMLVFEFPPNTEDELINDFLWDLKNKAGITIDDLGKEEIEE